MARDLSANLEAQVDGSSLRPFLAVDIDFETGVSRFWGGYGDITIDGNTYLGLGTFGSVSEIPESTENKATGITLSLSGIPSDLIAAALDSEYQGNACSVYLGALDDTHAVISSPYKVFSGVVDTMTVNQQSEAATISINVENRMLDFERPRARRYTDEDQRSRFSYDNAFRYVGALQEKQINWGVNFGK